MKRLLVLILALVMLCGIVSSCTKPEDPQPVNPNGNENQNTNPDENKEDPAPNPDTPDPNGNNENNGDQETPKNNALFNSEEKVIDIYLVAGQSNAVGYTGISDKSAIYAQAPGLKKGYSNVLFAGKIRWNGANGTVAYNDKYNWLSTKLGFGMGDNGNYMGPEAGMAQAFSEVYNTESGKVAGILKYGHGGTSLLQRSWSTMADGDSNKYGTWVSPSYAQAKFGISDKTYYSGTDRTGELYREFLQIIEQKLRFLVKLGYTNVNIKGLYWMQGENDRTQPDEYKVAFKYFVSDLRRDVANIVKELTGGDDRGAANMPIIVGTVSQTQNLNSATAEETNIKFIEMQKSLPSIVENCYVVDNSQYAISRYSASAGGADPSGLGWDEWHWNQNDHLEIGYNVGKKFLEIE